ncbi:MAG: type II toxin-antitoxin system VapC family toxin [Desulfurococcaceae archaeon]|nr:type II toxin-antitoxin system VapC family toxin [Desulfurococcaceae archaeon]
MYLFDASAIVNLVKKGCLKPLADGVTLDLAIYEALNAVWKEYAVLQRIDAETAVSLIEILEGVFTIIPLESIKNHETEVFKLASKEDLTIYDSSYVYVALKKELILITDDKKLARKASHYTKVKESKDLIPLC